MSDFTADDLDFGSAPPTPKAPSPPPGRPERAASDVAGDRRISPVSGRLNRGLGGKILAVAGLVAGSAVFLAATGSHPKTHKPAATAQEPVKQVVDFASVRAAPTTPAATAGGANGVPGALPPSISSAAVAPTLTNPGQGAPSLTSDGQIVPAIAQTDAAGTASPGSATSMTSNPTADAKAAAAQQLAASRAAKLQAIRSAPLLAYTTEVHTGDGAPPPQAVAARVADGSSELDQLRRGSAIGLVHAQRLPDRNFLITAGALLPCVLETALDTSAPGYVTCRISRDIYSDNGGVVLMEKGSRVLGEYRSGFQQGRARIFVLWNRITTPGGVAVDVSSPASDALGRAGFDGHVDTHFWQRFGGALLLTTLNGGLSAAAMANSRYSTIAQAPNEAAAVALANTIDIPPTLTKPQGSEVAIFVSRDLDFSGVYALQGRASR